MTAELTLPSPADALASLNPALRAELQGLIGDGVSANTLRGYEGVYARFDEWCQSEGQQSLPATAAAIGGYLAFLTLRTDITIKPGTLRHVVHVLSARQKAHGYGPLPSDTLMMANKAIKGHALRIGALAKDKAYPLVPDAIREACFGLHAAAQRGEISEFVWLRAGLMLTLAYSVAARESEVCGWRIGDIRVMDSGLDVYFWKSKTDREMQGVHRPVPCGHSVLTDPVTRLTEYLAYLESAGFDVTSPEALRAPLLRSVTNQGEPRRIVTLPAKVRGGDGTVREVMKTYGGLTVRGVDDIYRNACRIGGIAQWAEVSGHSPRSGFATTNAFALVPKAIWTRHGRWSVNSPVAEDYVQAVELVMNNPLNLKAVGL